MDQIDKFAASLLIVRQTARPLFNLVLNVKKFSHGVLNIPRRGKNYLQLYRAS